MKLRYTIKTALNSLRTHTARSVLTILGIVIGITAIILVMSVGQSAEALILNQIQGLGSRTIIVESGREPNGPSDFFEIFTNSLKMSDVRALKNPIFVQGVQLIAPNVISAQSAMSETETIRASIFGTSPEIMDLLEIYPASGNFISDGDVKEKASVVVLGVMEKEKLFGASDAIGEHIKIKGRNFEVIGVLPEKGQIGFFNVDELLFIPYSTAQEYLLGIDYFHSILIKAESEAIVPRVVKDIETTLRERHNITDPDKDDFHVMTQADAVERVGIITTILSAMLISVAGISLVVGGIGIMNIMLVSVTERTREIGLRKALGATRKNILFQFLLEAIILTVLGGVIGVSLGAFFAWIASLILSKTLELNWNFVFPMEAVFLGVGVAFMVGLVFGLYPARKASLKSPIEALRYE